MNFESYFDNAATTPVDRRVVDAMLPYLSGDFGNAHSLHQWGQRAKAAVELARKEVADLIGAEDPSEIVFTSGATESNNWVLANYQKVAMSPFEHSSLHETGQAKGAELLEFDGTELTPPDEADLVSMMLVNNETGQMFSLVHLHGSWAIHSDITQAVGKIPLSVRDLDLDFASLSGHKLHGPKGVGALYIRGGWRLTPMLFGGDQEDGRRAGTVNVPAIVGFGTAARLAKESMEENAAHVSRLNKLVRQHLAQVPSMNIWDFGTHSPYILTPAFLGVEGEALVIEMDRMGFGISSGAACSAGSGELSHVLTALGIEPEWIRGTVRLSFSKYNTEESAGNMADSLRQAVNNLRNLQS